MTTQNKFKIFKQTFSELTNTQKKSLIITIGLAIVIKFLPLTNYLSQTFSLMFHELGHAVTAWIFGHFAVPRFDMINGGGITDIFNRSFIISAIIFTFIAANLFYLKKQTDAYTMKKAWIIVVIFMVLFFTDLHYSLISFMGKGGELLFCFLVAWYALYHLRFKINSKAFIYLLLAMMLWINSAEDSIKLIFNEEATSKYLSGIQRTMGGDPLTNDLVKLSNNSGLSIDFFNYLLLFISVLTFYKIIKFTNKPPFSKARVFMYLKSLSTTIISQTKSIKNKSSKNKDLK